MKKGSVQGFCIVEKEGTWEVFWCDEIATVRFELPKTDFPEFEDVRRFIRGEKQACEMLI